MSSYVIRLPSEQAEQHHLDGLLNSLEHYFGVVSYSAVVVVTLTSELREVLGPLANFVIEAERDAPQGSGEAGVDGGASVRGEAPGGDDGDALTGDQEAGVTSRASVRGSGRICEECGDEIDARETRSKRFCSTTCYSRNYAKKYRKGGAKNGG